jgi:DNA-directed RNA polymerase subunit E'/Rpb7
MSKTGLVSPYITTEMMMTVSLYPHQMNNDIYIGLKGNIEDKYMGKCLKNYGYIMKIIEIIEYKGGIITGNMMDGTIKFDVKCAIKICYPIKNTYITCKITDIQRMEIICKRGAIKMIIVSDKINNDKFMIDNNNNIRYNKSDKLLEIGGYIKVNILAIKYITGDREILAIGYLDDISDENDYTEE